MVDPIEAGKAIEKMLTKNQPYGAKISLELNEAATGWNTPKTADWLNDSMQKASETFFQQPACSISEGGTIPFMAMLGTNFLRPNSCLPEFSAPVPTRMDPMNFTHSLWEKAGGLYGGHPQRFSRVKLIFL